TKQDDPVAIIGARQTGEARLAWVAYCSCRISGMGRTRAAGTRTPSAAVVTLPVPRSPEVNQSSWICSSDTGTSAITGHIDAPSGVGAIASTICHLLCRAP